MSHFRTRWLALVGAMLLVALSASSAFGAHPSHAENRGNAVSSFVHDLLFGTDEEPEQEEEADEEGDDEGEEENLDEEEQSEEGEEDSEFANHGQCVREVAWSLEVGGLNDNHGGAVSEAARFTCWEPAEDGEGEGEEGEEGETESLESDGSDDSAGPGRSAQAHANAPGKNKPEASGNDVGSGNGNAGGNGRGNGRGSH
jgi:hypothetical protein